MSFVLMSMLTWPTLAPTTRFARHSRDPAIAIGDNCPSHLAVRRCQSGRPGHAEALGSPVMDILQADLEGVERCLSATVDRSIRIPSWPARPAPSQADDLSAAFRSSVHKPLAQRMAVALTRQPPLWLRRLGRFGCGQRTFAAYHSPHPAARRLRP